MSFAQKLAKNNAFIDGMGVHFGGLEKGFKLRIVHHDPTGKTAFPLLLIESFEKQVGFKPVVRRILVPEKMELDIYPKLSLDATFNEVKKLERVLGDLKRQKVVYTMVGKVDTKRFPITEVVEFGERYEVPMMAFKEGEFYALATMK